MLHWEQVVNIQKMQFSVDHILVNVSEADIHNVTAASPQKASCTCRGPERSSVFLREGHGVAGGHGVCVADGSRKLSPS